ncbi:flagellar basal body rod protein FlgB [Salinisphaera sp. RV14]|uniref:flagellar basal body rod protein FlgB n=1 Tax=unclassified Salinisphaera TaxID=2649847 RepID=UPI003F825C13
MPTLDSINYFGAALQASARVQRLTASNIANADTPGYKARGVDFKKALAARLQHDSPPAAQYERGLPTGLDGNDVSADHESLVAAANATRMRESLTFLNGSTQSMITALRPNKGSSNG